ncbi:MAG: iron-sulfur cluster biosynthesis family protein [Bacteroidota bacterium]
MKIEPVSITSNALNAIKEIKKAKNVPQDHGLRIGRASAGASCGAASYRMGFSKKDDNDISYLADELPIYINKLEVLHLAGLKLDYVVEGEKSGFLFEREPV